MATNVPAGPGPSSGWGAAGNVPAWENTILNSLSKTGDLSGVPAAILSAIDQAESSGQGGAINSAGYGGFFGLSPNTKYPGGSVSTAELQDSGQPSFADQARVAASEFASLLNSYGGNIYEAEQAYQQGGGNAASYASSPGEGVQVFQSLGIPQTYSGKVTPSSNAHQGYSTPSQSFSWSKLTPSSIMSDFIGPFESWGVRIVLGVFGAALIIVALVVASRQSEVGKQAEDTAAVGALA